MVVACVCRPVANQALDTQETAARTTLIAAVKANNTADITTQCNTIGSIVAQRTANTAKADAAFYALLTADQQTDLDSLNNDGFFGPGFGIHVPGGRQTASGCLLLLELFGVASV